VVGIGDLCDTALGAYDAEQTRELSVTTLTCLLSQIKLRLNTTMNNNQLDI